MGVIDDLIATAQPRTETVKICARGDLVAAHAAAVAELDEATSKAVTLDDGAAGAAAKVVAIEEAIEAATVTFTVESVSRQRWADLLAANPPSKDERRDGKDSDEFVVASVAACVSDPDLSLAQSRQLADTLPGGEWNKLYQAALLLNITGTPSPKLPAATEILRVSTPSSTTSPLEGSLDDGSLVSGASL